MAELKSAQQDSKLQHQACMDLIEKKDSETKQLVSNSIATAKQEIESALASALQQQSKVLESNMVDLKKMLRERPPKAKRGREPGKQDMETDTES